jgi:hypothetical protein
MAEQGDLINRAQGKDFVTAHIVRAGSNGASNKSTPGKKRVCLGAVQLTRTLTIRSPGAFPQSPDVAMFGGHAAVNGVGAVDGRSPGPRATPSAQKSVLCVARQNALGPGSETGRGA